MKMGRTFCLSAALVLFLATSSMAVQGSKFAAHVSQAGEGMHLLESGVSDTTVVTGDNQCEAGDTFFAMVEGGGVCVKAGDEDIILETTIHTPNQKDLLIGVSLQNGLYTDTSVKGKNGSTEKAGAEAGILVWVEIEGTTVYPSQVVFNHRVQELNATLGGVIESCNVNLEDTDGDGIPDSGQFVVIDDCEVTDEEIGLILNTTSANHFNFVATNLGAGDHTVSVHAKALSSAAFLNGSYLAVDDTYTDQVSCEAAGGAWGEDDKCRFEIETTDNHASAWAVVDVGSLTVEEVRGINQLEDGINLD